MKYFKRYLKYFFLSIVVMIFFWILLASKVPCVPYLEDEEMILLLEKAKQKDLEALNNLTGFLSLREDKANTLLGRCAFCQLKKPFGESCNNFMKKNDCPDNAIEKIEIERDIWRYLGSRWCRITHIF